MYQYIYLFQIFSIVVTGCLVYLLFHAERIKGTTYRAYVIGTMMGLFIMQVGYGIFLQALTLEGLQFGEMICRIGKILAVTFWLLAGSCFGGGWKERTCHLVWMIALAMIAFVYVSPLRRMLRKHDSILQNQYFYYIQGEYTGLFAVGVVLLISGLLLATYLLGKSLLKGTGKRSGIFCMAGTVLPLVASLIPGSVSRYYDVSMVAGLLSALLLLITAGPSFQNSIMQLEKNRVE